MSGLPSSTVARLPLYLRALLALRSAGVTTVSSVDLAEMTGSNAAQVRKDLSYMGELGIRGVGYDADSLSEHLSRVLGIDQRRRAAVVGYGRLGGALCGYSGFGDRGIEIVAVFDTDAAKAGVQPDGTVVMPMTEFERVLVDERVELLILSTPSSAAQDVADMAISAGVCGILNFAPVRLRVPPSVAVRQVDLSTELDILSFYVSGADGRG